MFAFSYCVGFGLHSNVVSKGSSLVIISIVMLLSNVVVEQGHQTQAVEFEQSVLGPSQSYTHVPVLYVANNKFGPTSSQLSSYTLPACQDVQNQASQKAFAKFKVYLLGCNVFDRSQQPNVHGTSAVHDALIGPVDLTGVDFSKRFKSIGFVNAKNHLFVPSSALLETLHVDLTQSTVYSMYDKTWCIAKNYATPDAVQAALDWACGPGGADCQPIQLGNSCFLPNTVYQHASYAFNSYYQIHQHAAETCDFGGTATIVYEDPSYPGCSFPSRAGQVGASVSQACLSGLPQFTLLATLILLLIHFFLI